MYSVTTIFYDNGKIEARYTTEKDKPGEFEKFDVYIDVFETERKALKFITEAKKESSK